MGTLRRGGILFFLPCWEVNIIHVDEPKCHEYLHKIQKTQEHSTAHQFPRCFFVKTALSILASLSLFISMGVFILIFFEGTFPLQTIHDFWVSRKHGSVEKKNKHRGTWYFNSRPTRRSSRRSSHFCLSFFSVETARSTSSFMVHFPASYISLPEHTLPQTNMFAPEKWMVGILVLLIFSFGGWPIFSGATVDGQNPAPPMMMIIKLFIGF